ERVLVGGHPRIFVVRGGCTEVLIQRWRSERRTGVRACRDVDLRRATAVRAEQRGLAVGGQERRDFAEAVLAEHRRQRARIGAVETAHEQIWIARGGGAGDATTDHEVVVIANRQPLLVGGGVDLGDGDRRAPR